MTDARADGVLAARPADQPEGGGSTPTSALFRKGDYWVRRIEHSLALAMVEEHHYSRGGSNTAVYAHGLFRRSCRTECLGVAWWLPPTPDCGRKWWPDDEQAVLSLSRLVVVPGVPTNAATYLLMNSVRLIRKAGHKWRCLITQADTWRGHTGQIYRAAGWEDCGLGRPEDVWVDPATDRMVSRKAGPRTRTRKQMLELGYELKGRFAKYRYRLILPAPKERPNLFSALSEE